MLIIVIYIFKKCNKQFNVSIDKLNNIVYNINIKVDKTKCELTKTKGQAK